MTAGSSTRRAAMWVFLASAAVTAHGQVRDAELRAARASGEWLTHGGDYAETRFSTLDEIDRDTVARLGLAWSVEVGAPGGRVEGTPLVVDGVLYGTTTWSVTFAIDLATQALKWRYDPQVPRQGGPRVCCGPVNRGPAFYDGKVYVATLDGRLVALDAASGEVKWSVQTTPTGPLYSITGAPRVVQGKVVIGNGGGDNGARGFVTAYDAQDGKQVWRFYTIPGDPSLPFENSGLEAAAKTWTGEWWTRNGGGGTAWDSFAYDPQAELLYVGVGNGGPWNRDARSPGGGDNLYLASILALKVATGELVWHYQTTPGENWDFTAVQHMVLADLTIGGRERKVLMQAPKNGFYYVLDRLTGEFLSAEPFTRLNWASGIDAQGRPIETPGARYGTDPVDIYPSPRGGHNWHPMAWNPELNLMYIPGQEMSFTYRASINSELGIAFGRGGGPFGGGGGQAPLQLPSIGPEQPAGQPGFLLAWDPIAQKERWRVNFPSRENSGVLATAGNLVFAGTATGAFGAYDAETGKLLWSQQVYTNIATPISYEHDGKQYVAVLTAEGTNGRLLAFALDGTATAPGVAAR